MRLSPTFALLGLWTLACTGMQTPQDPGLSSEQIAKLVRKDVTDKQGWADDVRAALLQAGQIPDEDHACQVLAIIEQESGYAPDPEVPGLGKIALTELETEVQDKLGFLGPTALKLLLDVTPEGEPRTFRERLAGVRTERDLDRLFRDLVAYHESRAPRIAKAVQAIAPRVEEALNPISTAGSMQVSVSFALEHSEGLDREAVRELLYTRSGGVRFGTARLFAHEADYDKPLYRFADYNAGYYASRNAAFQVMIRDLTGQKITPDGDILIWNDRGKPASTDGQTLTALLGWRAASAPELLESQLRRDAKQEKTRSFEDTETWRRVREAWAAKTGKTPVYAQLPEVPLDSPKLRKDRTTAWFANSVDRRYQDCRKRNG